MEISDNVFNAHFELNPVPIQFTDLLDVDCSDTKYIIKLGEHNQRLVIFETMVLWLSGNTLLRQINVESRIIECLFTTFDSQKSENTKCSKVLVLVLEDQIRVYDRLKSTIVVSFPVHIRSAFSYNRGIVLGKKYDLLTTHTSIETTSKKVNINPVESESYTPVTLSSLYNTHSTPSSSMSNSAPYNDGIFLTLTDPVGEFGSVVSSSTTSFSQHEEMVLFPQTTNSTLAATFDPSEGVILVYYTRYIYRSKSSKAHPQNLSSILNRRVSKRSISTSNALLNQGIKPVDEDHRTLRNSSNPMSFDRMASGSEHLTDSSNMNRSNPTSSQDMWNLRKDVIFSKIHLIHFGSDINSLKIFTLAYKDKEVLVVVDQKLHQISLYNFEKSSNQVVLSKFKSDISIEGRDASHLDMGETVSYYLVILNENNELVLYNPFYDLYSSPIAINQVSYSKAFRIAGTQNYEVLMEFDNELYYSVNLQRKPLDSTVHTIMESLKYLSHDLIYENFWLHWYANSGLNIPYLDDWKVYVITLLALCFPDNHELDEVDASLNEVTELIPYVHLARKVSTKKKGFSLTSDLSLESLLPKIVLSLHIIREDLRLNVLANEDFDRISILLSQLVHWLDWSDSWKLYYKIETESNDVSLRLTSTEYISLPPNIMESLGSLFTTDLIPYITFSIVAGEDESIDKLITPRTHNVLRLFEVVISPEFEDLDLIKTMVSADINSAELETYPPGIYFILRNTIENCQKNLKLNWNVSSEELKLIDRNDLLLLESNKKLQTSHIQNVKLSQKSTKDIVSQLSNNETLSAWDGQAEADKFHVSKLIFSQDRRFYEVTRLLQTSKVQSITYETDTNLTDHERLVQQRLLCAKICLRTLTTPIGRGAVFNASRKPLSSEGFPIPKMNFNVLILPDNLNVSLETDSIPEYLIDWGFFHNGASSGLSVAKTATEINGSWIAFNKPPVLNAQHAGFLLGLGLNGHLKTLEEWHIYNYLGPKHVYTSIGLLIGMSASLRGTMNLKMAKILTVHVVAFLPPGSSNLNVPLPVQTAGLIGIGLIYLETQHRRVSEILLTQISASILINERMIKNEGYNLAAGFALGYINLGKGTEILSNTDNHLIDSLVSLSTFIRDVQTLKELDKSCTGATMALMLIFLRTNNHEFAEKLKLPPTLQLLEYIRPDLLILRCLSRNLIMWDSIKPSMDFVSSQLPQYIAENYSIETINTLESKIVPYINIVTGALLSIAFCFASTGNLQAKTTLLYYFDHLLNLSSIEPNNYDARSTMISVRNARDMSIISLSLIMAGTGDLDIMRRLRYLQGINDDYTRYGNYMAINMALGFLFLGGGQQAFKVSDNFSVAALITSVYPMFGSQNYEFHEETETSTTSNKNLNEYHDLHLQALRHFWALSVENRCLIIREVDGETPIRIEVDVYLKNETILRTPAPCLLPDLGLINKIRIGSNNTYFPVEFDLSRSSSNARERFKKTLTVYVDKMVSYKKLKLDYDDRLMLEERMERTKLLGSEVGVDCLKELNIFENLNGFEKDILFESVHQDNKKLITKSTVFDFKKEIENIINIEEMIDEEKLVNLKLIFNFVDSVVFLEEHNSNTMKRKRRKTSAITEESVDSSEAEFLDTDNHDDNNRGLYYLNVEFIERMKKDLFSRLI